MADNIHTKTLLDGPNRYILYMTNISDGTGEAAVIKADVSAMTGAPAAVHIRRIQACASGMAVQLLWDATTDELAWTIPDGANIDITFDPPIRNAATSGATGDLLLTTVGHTSGDTYSIVLYLEAGTLT